VEGAGNHYSEHTLVNFALAGLGSSKNTRYDTAVQLYNLEHENGKVFTLEDLERKFFSIDEKAGREQSLTRLAQGNVAHSHKGEKTSKKSQRNRTRSSANAVTDIDKHANITCYGCGEKGHIVSNCPKNKGKPAQAPTTARGNAAQETESRTSWNNELVCLACQLLLDQTKIDTPPNSGPTPLIHVSWDVDQLLNTKIFVSIAIRVDESTFNPEREKQILAEHLPSEYLGDLEPLNEPLWLLLHNRPLQDLVPNFA
jgi:hypothetical protein